MSTSESDLKSPETLQKEGHVLDNTNESSHPVIELRGKDVPRPKPAKTSKIPKPTHVTTSAILVTPKNSFLSGPTNESTRISWF